MTSINLFPFFLLLHVASSGILARKVVVVCNKQHCIPLSEKNFSCGFTPTPHQTLEWDSLFFSYTCFFTDRDKSDDMSLPF